MASFDVIDGWDHNTDMLVIGACLAGFTPQTFHRQQLGIDWSAPIAVPVRANANSK